MPPPSERRVPPRRPSESRLAKRAFVLALAPPADGSRTAASSLRPSAAAEHPFLTWAGDCGFPEEATVQPAEAACSPRSAPDAPCAGHPGAETKESRRRPPVKRTASVAMLLPSITLQRTCGPPSKARAVTRRASFLASGTSRVLESFDFDFTGANMEQMIKICHDMFEFSGVVDHFGLDLATLGNFFAAVASRYRDVPYHNFNHAVHVLHGTWMVLQCATAKRLLSWEDRLSLLVAALVHDLDHDGHSNSYHTHTHSDLARQYDNRSVLENHHCAVAFEVMGKENCALLDGLGSDLVARLRKSIADAILGTDMSNHCTMTRDFCAHAAEFDPASESDRRLLCSVILHAADIGAGVRPFHINDIHSRRVHREFQELADEEALLGIPVTLAVNCHDPVAGAQAECRFLELIVWPLWEHLGTVIPELAPAVSTLKRNRELYSTLASAGQMETEL